MPSYAELRVPQRCKIDHIAEVLLARGEHFTVLKKDNPHAHLSPYEIQSVVRHDGQRRKLTFGITDYCDMKKRRVSNNVHGYVRASYSVLDYGIQVFKKIVNEVDIDATHAPRWKQYVLDRGFWWHNDFTDECFVESEPTQWKKNSFNGHKWWSKVNNEHNYFLEERVLGYPSFSPREQAEVLEIKTRITELCLGQDLRLHLPGSAHQLGRGHRGRSRSRDRRGCGGGGEDRACGVRLTSHLRVAECPKSKQLAWYTRFGGIFQNDVGEDWYVVSPIGILPCLRWSRFAVPLEEVRQLRSICEYRTAREKAMEVLKCRWAELENIPKDAVLATRNVPQRAAVATFLGGKLCYVSCNGAVATAGRYVLPHVHRTWEWFRTEVVYKRHSVFAVVSTPDGFVPLFDMLATNERA